MAEKTGSSKIDETAEVFTDAEELLSKLNTEGKNMAVEYMEYLLSTGKYSTEDSRGSAWMPMFSSIHMT